ncbi:MAG: metal ABC transporter permease [Endomicrobiaceae bacterium]|nr:metal ABC transporter permease [Endomicrobiaceae bacterium]
MFEFLDFFNYSFFNRALILSILAGLSCGIIGVWIFLLNIPFIGVTIAHCAFAGAVTGLFIGINPIISGFVFSILAATIINPLSKQSKTNNNISVGLLFSFSIAVAFIFASLFKEHLTDIFSLFWGNLLISSSEDIILNIIIILLLLSFTIFFHKGIVALFFSREIAKSCGIPENLIFTSILLLICSTISLNLKSIGGLLIYSLISLPAATAYQLTYNLKTMYVLSVLFAVTACISGLFFSTLVSLPAGATIILFSCLIFFISLFFSKKKNYKK